MMLFLANRSEMQLRIREEIAKVHPDHKHSIMSKHSRLQMPFTEAFIHESQRLGNVTSLGLFRASSKDVTLKGHSIPKNTQIVSFLGEVGIGPIE